MLTATDTIAVTHAELIAPYVLRVHFNDQTTQQVDFAPFLAGSHNPLIRQYLDPVRFAAFAVHDGDLVWDDYALCFPVADLYDNTL